ncbi:MULTISPECIES: glyoxalase [unclassified Flavobacterium]|uniref:glyoxalase n=1 Tax=unclassified Flavobacterium TaxID=196869 RepID=UPI001F1466B7|nr:MULTISPECIES: glyoxalase [unclassified Flavobacterium]UMY64721.1 glyoxalase [Flavobacterium sp. HJ-32-4]
MESRDQFLSGFRGEAIGRISPESVPDEIFQNGVLRPILKLQNDLFLSVFRNYVAKSKVPFHEFPLAKKLQFIEHSIQRDIKFRNSLKGIIIGLFSVAEYERYIQNSSALNKRMMQLLIERLKDQVQLFDANDAVTRPTG